MIYADANATTPLDPVVLEAMMPWLRGGFHNPSGVHAGARAARLAVDEARAQVAALIGADPSEIVFTGGGTESNNSALQSLDALCGPGQVLASAVEHSAVLRCAASFARGVRLAAVTPDGVLDVQHFQNLLPGAAMASVMWANNETGVCQPVREACALACDAGLPFHCDAVQAAGKIPVDVRAVPVDLLSLSAHKLHGPKGVGALYVRRGLRFVPLLYGGGQENGRRSGTENVAGIVGFGAAAALAREALAVGGAACPARDAFERAAGSLISGITIHGAAVPRLPNTSHFSLDRCDAAGLLILLDEAGVACSAGSACMSGKQAPSHVQIAMGIPERLARSSLRISFQRQDPEALGRETAHRLAAAVTKLRRVQGSGVGPVVVYHKP